MSGRGRAQTGALSLLGAGAALLAYRFFRGGDDDDAPEREPLPAWAESLEGEALRLPEWDNSPAWRLRNSFKGSDYAHGPRAAVHVSQYYLKGTAGAGSTLTAAVHFGPGAESHRGLCHGGSMCTTMDDVVGWTGFCSTGRCVPWSGFTVQVNTKLMKPVAVGSWLRLEGVVTSVKGRKVTVTARLTDPDDGATHCEAEGLVVLKKGA